MSSNHKNALMKLEKQTFGTSAPLVLVPVLFHYCLCVLGLFGFFQCRNCFSCSWVLPVVCGNPQFIFSWVCFCFCMCVRQRDRARKRVSKYIIMDQRMSGLALIVFSASFSKRVWWGADWPAEDYSVSWIPWGVSGWADLLLAHTCSIRPKDPPALSGIWCGGRHSVSWRLPGGLWQLWWHLRLCWQVKIADQSINQKSDPNWKCVHVCIIGYKYKEASSVQVKTRLKNTTMFDSE